MGAELATSEFRPSAVALATSDAKLTDDGLATVTSLTFVTDGLTALDESALPVLFDVAAPALVFVDVSEAALTDDVAVLTAVSVTLDDTAVSDVTSDEISALTEPDVSGATLADGVTALTDVSTALDETLLSAVVLEAESTALSDDDDSGVALTDGAATLDDVSATLDDTVLSETSLEDGPSGVAFDSSTVLDDVASDASAADEVTGASELTKSFAVLSAYTAKICWSIPCIQGKPSCAPKAIDVSGSYVMLLASAPEAILAYHVGSS